MLKISHLGMISLYRLMQYVSYAMLTCKHVGAQESHLSAAKVPKYGSIFELTPSLSCISPCAKVDKKHRKAQKPLTCQ